MKQPRIILTLTDVSTGGIGTHVINTAKGLRDKGWQPHIVVTNSHGNLFNHVRKEFECHDLSAIPLTYKKIAEAAHLVNSILPDVLLLSHCSLSHYTLPLLKRSIKPVAVIHSDDSRFYQVATLFARRIFRWIAPSSGTAEGCRLYLRDGIHHRIRVIPHGVNGAVFYPGKREFTEGQVKISFVGFLGENKGADVLPHILKAVEERNNRFEVSIVGTGPLRGDLEKSLGDLGLLDRCFFAGLLEQNSVAQVLRDTDILLLPTRIEGFGLSLVEAMMCGAVPVVSHLEGITDSIVENGVTGFLVEQDDIRGYANAIVYLFKNPDRLRTMSQEAALAATERFPEEEMLNAYERLFAEEDDRRLKPCRGALGWLRETMAEIVKGGIDGKWLGRRMVEIWK